MPIDLRFSTDQSRADLICSGRLSGKELREKTVKLLRPENLPRLENICLDYTSVKSFDLNLPDLEFLAEQAVACSKIKTGIMLAVITNRLLAVRLTRLWEALARHCDFKVQIFATHEEAEAWLARQ